MIGNEYDRYIAFISVLSNAMQGVLKWQAFPSPTIKTFSENKNAKAQTSLHAFSFLPMFIQQFAHRVK